MISFKPVKTLLSLHKLECDECGKSVDITIDERNGDAETQLAALEPYERAALSRQGCPHAAPAATPEPGDAPAT